MNSVKEIASFSPAYRYDIFKGTTNELGKITKQRSIGFAFLREGQRTLLVSLKTFLEDRFYLLPANQPDSPINYVILTREVAHKLRKKYFWNSVGEGRILEGVNHGLMKLTWDVLADDLYMSLHPLQARETSDIEEFAA